MLKIVWILKLEDLRMMLFYRGQMTGNKKIIILIIKYDVFKNLIKRIIWIRRSHECLVYSIHNKSLMTIIQIFTCKNQICTEFSWKFFKYGKHAEKN